MRTTRLTPRLLTAFAAVLLVGLAGLAFGGWRVMQLGEHIDELTTVQRERDRLAEAWRSAIVVNTERWTTAALADSRSTFDQLRPAMARTTQDVSAVQKRFLELENSPEGRQLQARLAETRTPWLAARDTIASAIEAGDMAGARQLAQGDFQRITTTYLEAAQAMVAGQQRRSEAMAIAARADAQRTLAVIGAVALASAVLATLLALALARSVVRPLAAAVSAASRVAQGDLSQDIPETARSGRDEVAQLLAQVQQMQVALRTLVQQVAGRTHSVDGAAVEIAGGTLDLSQRTERAASHIQQTAASMEQLTSTVQHTAASAQQAHALAAQAAGSAEAGAAAMDRMITTMRSIADGAGRIGQIVATIDGIAFQTNLLALNAAVEAARAGAQGRGFAVVAGEVRALAQRASAAAREIKGLVESSDQNVQQGVASVDSASQTMAAIDAAVRQVRELLAAISAAAAEQSQGLGQIHHVIGQLDQMTQHNAALVEQSAAAAESLREQARDLALSVQAFKVA